MWEGEEESDVALMDEVRVRVEELFCGGNGRMVIHPSGTDAETMPLLQAILESRAIARSVDPSSRPEEYADCPERGNVVSLVACAGEVGSGTTEAAMGRFFSKSVPLGGNRVAMGQELPALHDLADMDAIDLVARGGAGTNGAPLENYDELVESEARKALAADPAAVVVLHTVAGSKTGLRLPSPDVAARLREEFGERVVSVLDACQMRHHPALIPRWLDEQGPVLDVFQVFRRAAVSLGALPARRRRASTAPRGPRHGRPPRRGVRVVPHTPRHRRRLSQAARRDAPRVLQRRRLAPMGGWPSRDGDARRDD